MKLQVLSWTDVCALPWLKNLPCKVETNGFGKIMVSPASSWHGGYQSDIAYLLRVHLPGGRVLVECPVDTSDGTRVADVAWISRERWLPHRRSVSLPVAPEICVEILSPSNRREEMLGKMGLYFVKVEQQSCGCAMRRESWSSLVGSGQDRWRDRSYAQSFRGVWR